MKKPVTSLMAILALLCAVVSAAAQHSRWWDEAGRMLTLLHVVNFQLNSADLAPSSHGQLDSVAAMFKRDPGQRYQIQGYSDAGGDGRYNLQLSLARATAVRNYLISKGVRPENVVAAGYGKDKPVADNKTEAGRAANRRAEIILVDSQERLDALKKNGQESGDWLGEHIPVPFAVAKIEIVPADPGSVPKPEPGPVPESRPEPEPKPVPESRPEPEPKPGPKSWPEPESKTGPEFWSDPGPEPGSWSDPESAVSAEPIAGEAAPIAESSPADDGRTAAAWSLGFRLAYGNSSVSGMQVTRYEYGDVMIVNRYGHRFGYGHGFEAGGVALVGLGEYLALNLSPGLSYRIPFSAEAAWAGEWAFTLPALLELRFFEHVEVTPRALAGIQLDIPFGAKMNWNNGPSYKIEGRSAADFALAVGISVHIRKDIFIDARYALGLTSFIGGESYRQGRISIGAGMLLWPGM